MNVTCFSKFMQWLTERSKVGWRKAGFYRFHSLDRYLSEDGRRGSASVIGLWSDGCIATPPSGRSQRGAAFLAALSSRREEADRSSDFIATGRFQVHTEQRAKKQMTNSGRALEWLSTNSIKSRWANVCSKAVGHKLSKIETKIPQTWYFTQVCVSDAFFSYWFLIGILHIH